MKLFFRLFLYFGSFLIVAAAAYGVHAREYEGLTLELVVAGSALLIGAYGASVLGRARASVAAATEELGPASADEPHVGPTIWPFVYALSAIGIIAGSVGNRWLLVPGGVLFLAATIGWVVDVHWQWHHHLSGGHGGEHAEHGGADLAMAPAQAGSPHQEHDASASSRG